MNCEESSSKPSAIVDSRLKLDAAPLSDVLVSDIGGNRSDISKDKKDGFNQHDFSIVDQGKLDFASFNDSSLPKDTTLFPEQALIPDKTSMNDSGIIPATWITIKAGTFNMGSLESEPCRITNETRHQVTLTHDFEIQSTEVTEGQYLSLLPASEGILHNIPNHPIAGSWAFAVSYCNALSAQQGLTPCYSCKKEFVSIACDTSKQLFCKEFSEYVGSKIYSCPGYRLPTEAEWEYAYRAGSETSFYNGTITECSKSDPNADQIAWYEKNSDNQLNTVGLKKPNAWGLYDMAGNATEWMHDLYQADLGTSAVTNPGGPTSADPIPPCFRPARVLKGGSYISQPAQIRGAWRGYSSESAWAENSGFRCVRTLP
jgi:formylglycine-generating enzyme required for sulfatase activity